MYKDKMRTVLMSVFKLFLFSLLILPLSVQGQVGPMIFETITGSGGSPDTIADILSLIINQILNPLAGLLIVLALVVFLWGMIKYLRVAGEEDKENAKRIMWWGIVALFVMVSVWGLVQILVNTFFAGGIPSAPPIPSF